MIDRKKILAGLEFTKAMITFNPSTGEDIEPENLNEADKTSYDACVGAIALLKEQEPTTFEPHYIDVYSKHFVCGVECGACHKEISSTYHYCPWCGRQVKWE